MARLGTAFLVAALALAAIAGPAGAKEFGRLYAEGAVYRTFASPALVDPGTGRDPIYTFTNSTNPDQFSVARFAPGDGSHGGRWMVFHATWINPTDASILVTDYETLAEYQAQGRLTIVRDEAADFRCPILPNG
jgi:hypothetical protein